MTRQFHNKKVLQQLSKILHNLEEEEEYYLPREHIYILFAGASFDDKIEQARRFAQQHSCLFLFADYTREPATFFKLASLQSAEEPPRKHAKPRSRRPKQGRRRRTVARRKAKRSSRHGWALAKPRISGK